MAASPANPYYGEPQWICALDVCAAHIDQIVRMESSAQFFAGGWLF